MPKKSPYTTPDHFTFYILMYFQLINWHISLNMTEYKQINSDIDSSDNEEIIIIINMVNQFLGVFRQKNVKKYFIIIFYLMYEVLRFKYWY